METERLKLIIEVEYDANPADYGTDDPEKMVTYDITNLEEGVTTFDELFDCTDENVKIRGGSVHDRRLQ